MLKPFKKPDLNAPRFRPKILSLTNKETYQEFLKEHPKLASSISLKEFKEIINSFNGAIWQKVIEERDGVELPEQLGYIFIGTCPKKVKTPNINESKSAEAGFVIQNQNWESDQYLAKIFYTNFETKYRFKNHDLWSFKGVRIFKRTVAKVYPVDWKKYVVVDSMTKVSRLFRIQKFKQLKAQTTEEMIKQYDEFNLNDPWQEQA